MNKSWSLFLLSISILAISIFSCKRENVDVIGPEVAIASPNFKITNTFNAHYNTIDFGVDSNWFTAVFNERVSWTITVRGLKSKAEKVISGTSNTLSKTNAGWSGGHSGLYFFNAGEDVVAELSVFGSKDKWYDTLSIVGEKNNYGNDVIVWWDNAQIGVAKTGTVYWYDFFDTKEKILDTIYEIKDPIQGLYRAFEGKDGLGPSTYFIGALAHTPLSTPTGFSNTALEDVYLNFYLRRRTLTSSLNVELISDVAGVQSDLSYNVGEVTWDSWKLVSIRLSEMKLTAGSPAFDPSRITFFRMALQVVSGPDKDQSGVDIDFITITKGGSFKSDKY